MQVPQLPDLQGLLAGLTIGVGIFLAGRTFGQVEQKSNSSKESNSHSVAHEDVCPFNAPARISALENSNEKILEVLSDNGKQLSSLEIKVDLLLDGRITKGSHFQEAQRGRNAGEIE